MALPREERIASTRAVDLESMARLQEEYPAVDAYQICCTMCAEANVVPAVESIVTGAVPWPSSSMEIVSGLLRRKYHHTCTSQYKKNQ